MPTTLLWVFTGFMVAATALWFTTQTSYQEWMLGGIISAALLAMGLLLLVVDVGRVPAASRGPDKFSWPLALNFLLGYTLMMVCRSVVTADIDRGPPIGPGIAGSCAGAALWLALRGWWAVVDRRRRPLQAPTQQQE
jgi:hypothetical protein